MSKKQIAGDLKLAGVPMEGYALYSHDISDLEGRMLTLIEGIGLPEGQERAIKSLVRREIQELYSSPQIAGEFLFEALEKTRESGIGWSHGGNPSPMVYGGQ